MLTLASRIRHCGHWPQAIILMTTMLVGSSVGAQTVLTGSSWAPATLVHREVMVIGDRGTVIGKAQSRRWHRRAFSQDEIKLDALANAL